MAFDDTNGTQDRDSEYQSYPLRKPLLSPNYSNSGFAPSYAYTGALPHVFFIVVGLALFLWLVLPHILRMK
jgi:hypothetical protein